MSTFFGIQMAGRQGNLLLLRKIFPYSDLGIVLIGDNIGFYIVSLVGQVIMNINGYTVLFGSKYKLE